MDGWWVYPVENLRAKDANGRKAGERNFMDVICSMDNFGHKLNFFPFLIGPFCSIRENTSNSND